jgi:hypothetical protein
MSSQNSRVSSCIGFQLMETFILREIGQGKMEITDAMMDKTI